MHTFYLIYFFKFKCFYSTIILCDVFIDLFNFFSFMHGLFMPVFGQDSVE